MSERQQAVVTGGASGIGRATVRRLAQDGYAVLSLDREEKANAAAAEADRAEGLNVTAAPVDITDRATVKAALGGTGRIDLLVNVAGVLWQKAFDDLTEDDFRRMLDVHVVGTFVMSQEAIARMQPGARIVNVSSRTYAGSANFAHYVAAKAAVVGLTRAMAMDLADRKIAVNVVAPGLVDTPMPQVLPADLRDRLAALEPGGKFADPTVIAETIAFLGRAGSHMNGQVVVVDGGKSLGGIGI